MVFRSLAGVSAALVAPNVWSYIGDRFDYKIRGKITGIIASALSLGLIFGVPVASFIAKNSTWRYTFYLLGFAIFIVSLFSFIFLEEPKRSRPTKIAYFNRFKDVFAIRVVDAALTVTALVAFANFGLYTFLGSWLRQSFYLDVSQIGIFLIPAGLGNLLGMLLGGRISDKIGKMNVAFVSTLMLFVVMILLPLTNYSVLAAAISVFLWLGFGGSAFAVLQVLVTNLSKEQRGTVDQVPIFL